MMPRLAALLLLVQLATSQMKFGKDEDDDKVHVSAMEVKCSMCMVLVEDIWDKARGEFGIGGDCDEDEEHCGGSGMTVWKEDEVLQLVQDSCGSEKNWAPPFTQDYELAEVGDKWVFRPEQEAVDGLPKPVFSMDWKTRAMKKACNLVVTEEQEGIAELIYLGLNKAKGIRDFNIDDIQKKVCLLAKACAPPKKKKKKNKLTLHGGKTTGGGYMDDGGLEAAKKRLKKQKVKSYAEL